MTIFSKIIKLKDSVDVYQIPVDADHEKLQFYKINTREKSAIRVAKGFALILSRLDGKSSLEEVLRSCDYTVDETEMAEIVDHLVAQGYAEYVIPANIDDIPKDKAERYKRQINYFENLVSGTSGSESQKALLSKEVTIIGCGAVGSAIAAQLVRAGLGNLVLVDYKRVRASDMQRHIYFRRDELGNYKTEALARYLKRIDSSCSIRTLNEKIVPHSEVDSTLTSNTDLVVNSADEPYIGHITVKLGRFLWPKKIALYVAGGFDAHSMSTGELIANGITPCVDCCSNTFKVALRDWVPTYVPTIDEKTSILSGGAGGIVSQSLFSASIAAMNIIRYLVGDKTLSQTLAKRGEYLVNQGKMTWIEMNKQGGCDVCNIR